MTLSNLFAHFSLQCATIVPENKGGHMAKKSTKAAAKAAAPATTTTKTKVTVSTARKKTPKQMLDILLIAACLVLSVIVVVLSISHSIDPHTAIVMLSIGLACLSAYVLNHAASR